MGSFAEKSIKWISRYPVGTMFPKVGKQTSPNEQNLPIFNFVSSFQEK